TWNAFDLTGANINWTFNPTVSGATVTMTVTGVSSGRSYQLMRDGLVIATDTDSDTTANFAVTGGWSSHTMQISATSSGGGGGGTGASADGRPYFSITYPNAGLLDWITGQDTCRTVQ